MACEKIVNVIYLRVKSKFYKLHEWLVQKNDDKATILIVDHDIDTLTVTANTAESWYLIS